MDDYWRKTIGNKTTKDQQRHSDRHVARGATNLDDFSDVFGGPPRTLFAKTNRSGGVVQRPETAPGFGFPSPSRTLYRDVFLPSEVERIREDEGGRSLQSFRIPPVKDDNFYDEVFGVVKNNEGSGDNVPVSKLRPINVKSKWKTVPEIVEEQPKEDRHVTTLRSPETMTQEPTSHPSFKASADFMDLNSPTSGSSSFCKDASSYVIELNSHGGERTDPAVSIEEAIAWAKQKFLSDNYNLQPPKDNSSDIGVAEEEEEEDFEEEEDENLQLLSLLDEDVRTWSAGKETNIRLLLSTLHLLLWPSSGWYAVQLGSLKESSQVKKAYQRARLCLHPDKLQQRGVTFPQRYVAEKAFPILQEAWATYISRDALFC